MTEAEKAYFADLKARDARKAHIREFALTLLQQCKDENLSMREMEFVMEIIKSRSLDTTLRDGLKL